MSALLVDDVSDMEEFKSGKLTVLPNPKPDNESKESKPKPISKPVIRNAGDLLADSTIKPPPLLIDGLLHQGLKAVVAGPPKAGKTLVLMDMAMCVANGIPFLEHQTTQSRALFINMEVPEPFIRNRIQALVNKKNETADKPLELTNLDVLTLRGQDGTFEDTFKVLAKEIRSSNYGLIIVDPIYKGMVGRDENSSKDMSALCLTIEKLASDSGAAVVYAHHFSKGRKGATDVLDRMSGSGVFARDADTIINLTPHKDDDCYVMETVTRNLASPDPVVLQRDYPVLVVRPDLNSKDLEGKPGRPSIDDEDELLGLLKEPLSYGEWSKKADSELEMKKGSFETRRKKLIEAGKVEKDGDGKWCRVETPSPSPAEDET